METFYKAEITPFEIFYQTKIETFENFYKAKIAHFGNFLQSKNNTFEGGHTDARTDAQLRFIYKDEMGSKSGFMRGFQKGITLDDKTSRSVNLVGLQNRVAKKFAKFLHLTLDLGRGS